MLSREDNDLVCRVGPGTPMGTLMRQYWIPLLQTEDLEADGAPQRIRLLGENLIAFRDSSGAVGLLQNHCPHRGASLFFGRNEAAGSARPNQPQSEAPCANPQRASAQQDRAGLRCVYHGWKFDTTGACVDMPNEPAESDFRTKVKATAYPCRERNGVIWTYLGPRPEPPPLPELGWALVPAAQRQSLRYARACNWLQALEGDIDSSHVNYLHRRLVDNTLSGGATLLARTQQDRTYVDYFRQSGTPTLQVVDTDVGVTYGARRPGGADGDFWRITQFLLPFHTSIPSSGTLANAKVWVPLDDEHTLVWEPSWSLDGSELSELDRTGRVGRVPATGFLPPSTDWLGQWNFTANQSNDYFLDRQKQKTINYTGLDDSNPLQDGAIQESMGAVFDRGTEHLGSADAMIIRVRRRLLEVARALRDDGQVPPGVDTPALYRRRGVQLTLPPDANWLDATAALVHQVLPTA